jgi:hypothetical protein
VVVPKLWRVLLHCPNPARSRANQGASQVCGQATASFSCSVRECGLTTRSSGPPTALRAPLTQTLDVAIDVLKNSDKPSSFATEAVRRRHTPFLAARNLTWSTATRMAIEAQTQRRTRCFAVTVAPGYLSTSCLPFIAPTQNSGNASTLSCPVSAVCQPK